MKTDTLAKAKTQIVMHHPFFATILFSVPIEADSSIPTAATDGTCILYNAEWFATLTVNQIMFVLAHEVMHITMLHPWRRDDRTPKRWNIAVDHVSNLILKQAGFELFDWVYADQKFSNYYAEKVYNELDAEDEDETGGHMCVDEHMDASGDQAERAQAEAKARNLIIQAAKTANAAGKLPGSLKELIDETLAPKVNWREELRRYMTAVLKTDQSWARGQRRFLAQGLYLPATHSEGMGEIVIGVDTSGSVWSRVPEFLAECEAIAADCSPQRIHVVYCDTNVNTHDEYEAGDTIIPKQVGGGGTDLTSIFDYLEVKGINPSVCVVCTDLETPFGVEPGFPVIWAATTNHVPPYGDVVRLGD